MSVTLNGHKHVLKYSRIEISSQVYIFLKNLLQVCTHKPIYMYLPKILDKTNKQGQGRGSTFSDLEGNGGGFLEGCPCTTTTQQQIL